MNGIFFKDFIKWNKRQINSFIILSCLLFCLLIIIQIYAQITENLIPYIRNKDENKIIHVSFDYNNIEKFKKLISEQNIENISYYMKSINVHHDMLGNIVLTAILPNEVITTESGKVLDNSKNEIIISEMLYQNISNVIEDSKITLYVENKIIECRIAGFYRKQNEQYMNKVYVSDNIIKEFQSDTIEYLVMEKEQNEVNQIIQTFQLNNINAELLDNSYQSELNSYINLLAIMKPFIYVIISLYIMIIFIFVNDIINDKLLSLVILKLFGYTNLTISLNIFFAIFLFIFPAYLIQNIILMMIFYFINLNFHINLIYFVSFNCIIFIIINLLILIIVLSFIYKLRNIKLLNVLYNS